ncbi:hypothetical protein [Pistricoccus aurantiacus]|uniref:hypothetical protein n=1 Tax=Pistricoccus aurantiacus TaxID=1883414 RepID=UPI0036250A85
MPKSPRIGTAGCLLLLALTLLLVACTPQDEQPQVRRVVADVVAINQPIQYNRFGSINPWGMMYALRRDTVGTEPGEAVLRDGKRPRPLVLRVTEGDELEIRFQNLLMPYTADDDATSEPAELQAEEAETAAADEGFTVPDPPNDPRTRRASIAVVGLTNLDGNDAVATGLVGVEPGGQAVYRFRAEKAGAYFFSSLEAMAGGEGNGGSLTHGMFGMVIVEPAGSRMYRSQVTAAELACARGAGPQDCGVADAGPGWLDYEAKDAAGVPILNMLQAHDDGTHEIVHGDLTAIIVNDEAAGRVGQPATSLARNGSTAWREFTVMFHDELKTVHAEPFSIFNEPPAGDEDAAARHKQMVGIRDGFGINYGASGMGPILLANRFGMGPAKDCVDCAYEEFFLQSWANGDPALLAQYLDDPSNVYHSYLGDRVKFHNVHAGPKETHVFHLHAHQWLSQRDSGDANYLDSQTIAPFQAFSYEIYYGGTGNRNLTPGDSIFHCHLYPHFAQGMWALWRVHEVIEDGSRRLPDGGGMAGDEAVAGIGTDPETGATTGGTPIPGLVPLPGQALPPEPTYVAEEGDEAMPGYPFYIAGKAGFRAPQAPLDIAEDGGLPRHLTLEGTRTLKPLETALDEADMTFPIETVKLEILPQDGTPLEKAAMAFHATPGGVLKTQSVDDLDDASSSAANFLVNGLPPAPGAPFANPCPVDTGSASHWINGLPSLAVDADPSTPAFDERRYDVSAIELELVVNKYGWHDKQARINVLDRQVGEYENRTRAADPFFFRAASGECIAFRHTNRTPGQTSKDAFQVATPVDVIGQHIHLVKFDVTASDGSGNGFNYEDGTLARDHIGHLLEAANAPGGTIDWSRVPGDERPLALKTDGGEPVYQSTMQRWWADPLLDGEGQDRTIATVFTHDHFGPSTIQQHGFYSALLIEPKGSQWLKPDGTPLADPKGQAVGTQAIIVTPEDAEVTDNLKGARREFALAVADFALLYDHNDRPVAPPQRPEAISVDHHDPYLFNYKHEPMPLRIATSNGPGNWRQKSGPQGDMARVFESDTHARPVDPTIDERRNHAPGDPSTEIFEAYDGDRVQVRLIQGAQEVQHVFTVNGQRWKRQPAKDEDIWVSSQEIGISEHMEMEMQVQPPVLGDANKLTTDYLYHAGTVDALWNGAWGLMRSYADPETADLADATAGLPMRCRLAVLGGSAGTSNDPACAGRVPATTEAQASELLPRIENFEGLASGNGFRPPEVTARLFCVEAVQGPLVYNDLARIADPDAVRFVLRRTFVKTLDANDPVPACPTGTLPAPAGSTEIPVAADTGRPLVLRMRAGEMAYVGLTGKFAAPLAPTEGNAVLPPIVSWTEDGLNVAQDRLTPSNTIGLHPSLVSYAVRTDDGVRVGKNIAAGAGLASQTAGTGGVGPAMSAWYGGRIETRRSGATASFDWIPFTSQRGVVAPLSSMADPIRHPVMGLVGALIIEPEGAEITSETEGGTVATICSDDEDCFREFVLVYQDGLNLKQEGEAIPDCHVCDDSYDSGDIALNYRSEPLWARLDLPRQQAEDNPETGRPQLVDLNSHDTPTCFLLPDWKPIATPIFKAEPGERVVIRAVHPGGRARQRTLVTYGHSYADLTLPKFGSPSSSLLAPPKAISADLGPIKEGLWLYRDGPAYFVSGGAWGYIDARTDEQAATCPLPDAS